MRDHAALALRIGHEDAQGTGDDQKKRGIIFAVAVEQRAAGQSEPVGLGEKILQRAVAHIFQKRETLESLAQFLRIERLLADAERREERHAHACITKRSNHHQC